MTPRRTGIAAFFALALAAVILPGNAMAFPWSLDMWVQPSSDPYEKPVLYPQNSLSKNATPQVPREEIETVAQSPVEATEKSVKRGEELFVYNCVSCHGQKGRGDGLIIQKGHGFYPVDLTGQSVVARTDGFIYAYIMYGGKVMMPAYAENMPLQGDAWHIVNYVRHLQNERKGREN